MCFVIIAHHWRMENVSHPAPMALVSMEHVRGACTHVLYVLSWTVMGVNRVITIGREYAI